MPRASSARGGRELVEVELGDVDTASGRRVEDRVDLVPAGLVPAREHEHDRQGGQAAGEIGGELEARRVREVDVLHQQHQRALRGGPRRGGDTASNSRARSSSGATTPAPGRAPSAAKPGREPRDLVRPLGALGRRAALARGRRAAPPRARTAARRRGRARCTRRSAALRRARRAARWPAASSRSPARRAGDDGTGARTRSVPARKQRRARIAADEGGGGAAGRRGRTAGSAPEPHDSRRGPPAAAPASPSAVAATPRGSPRPAAGRPRRCDRQRAPQALGQPGVGGERGRAVAAGREPAHEPAVRLLAQRIERDLGTRAAYGFGRVAGRSPPLRERFERLEDALAVGVARPGGPILLQAGQQLAVAERERVGGAAGGHQRFEGEGVHRRPASGPGRPSRVAIRCASAPGPSARRSAHTALRRLARALVSSTSGQKRAASVPRSCPPGCKREPGEQRPRALARRRLDRPPSSSAPTSPSSRTRSMADPTGRRSACPRPRARFDAAMTEA